MGMAIAKLHNVIKRLHHDEDGLTAAEIMVVVGIIVIPLVIVLSVFGQQITDWVKELIDSITETKPDKPTGIKSK